MRTPPKEMESTLGLEGPLFDQDEGQQHLTSLYQRWRDRPTLENAIEVVDRALTVKDPFLAIGPAQAILDNGNAMPAAQAVAKTIASGRPNIIHDEVETEQTVEQLSANIRNVRQRLLDEPRNGLLWLEKARLHTQKAEIKSAEFALKRALACAPNDRFVLRAFARFMGHVNKFDEAHDRLLRSESLKVDPWLQAAEIAIAESAKIPPHSVRWGRDILERHQFAPRHISELAAALGTLEATAGRNRKAQHLFETSLKNPTDNALSQAYWARDQMGLNVEISQEMLGMERAFEARVQAALASRNFVLAVENCDKWLSDEPFSVRASVDASYIASSYLWDQRLSAKFCTRGLIANPDNKFIANNLIVAHARLGNIPEAEKLLLRFESFTSSANPDPVLLATQGLVRFRKGKVIEGRTFYLQALAIMDKTDDADMRFRCRSHWLYEEARAGTITSEEQAKLVGFLDETLRRISINETTKIFWPIMRKRLLDERIKADDDSLKHMPIGLFHWDEN